MAWLEKRKNWITPSDGDQPSQEKRHPARRSALESMTVTQAALALGVDRKTVRKYLALDPEEGGPIGYDEWYRLPGGHIRIRAEAVERLMSG